MRLFGKSGRARLMIGAAIGVLAASSGQALAQDKAPINIPPQSLASALYEFGGQTGRQVMFTPEVTASKTTAGVSEGTDEQAALAQLLQGTGLTFRREANVFVIVQGGSEGPQSAGAGGDVDALIVTAQKREENIQDVPIAISAFSQEDLTRSQVAGGPDLITQVPNMTFTKTNFSSYSVQIRGIGTQAISATTDPAVAVAFNNTPFIRNRFFEQEFYDLQRVEVLRGPQGTLYGRNATAGVVNIISAKPRFVYEAKASGDVSNFNSSRIEGMVNVPLVEDKVALRIAGAWTKRDGYATNELTGNPIDGRDLWSTRLSLRFTPTDRIDANLIWEHFQEDDDRLRSGKQLCKKHVVTEVGGISVLFAQEIPDNGQGGGVGNVQATFSQGCERGSLYSPDAFQTVNGLSVPYYAPLGAIYLPTARFDPYVSTVQSTDLRVIESTVDPEYRAKADLGELQISFDLSDTLTLASETAYSVDTVFSMQDFNRFNTAPGAWSTTSGNGLLAIAAGVLDEDGFFCDPQLGCSDRLVAVDVSTADARQFSQEFRLSSDFDGPFNFSLGANWLRADSVDKYYVFINSLSMIAALSPYGHLDLLPPYVPGVTDNVGCMPAGPEVGDPRAVFPVANCTYIDPNPIGSLNDEGHNYFLSKNPYKLISYAAFGEVYYNITDNLKITGGLRWTVDKKEAPIIPSWTLASNSVGYPVAEVIEQEWREPTGRLTLDWKPDLGFTDETMIYASYAHGYKAGGANPPRFTYVFYGSDELAELTAEASATRPKTFDAEFVDAFELGAKNTLVDGRLTLNLAGFYYDYTGYQVSEIVDRSAFNRNFDATVWGVELEADWRPLENLRLGFKGGYEKTRIKDGEQAIDLMDRTAGHDDWVVVRPFPTFASSCILPAWLYLPTGRPPSSPLYGLGGVNGGNPGGCEWAYIVGYDPVTQAPYTPNPTGNSGSLGSWLPGTYPGFDPSMPEINNGEGFLKDLGGNELPNAPNWTATITGDYTVPLPNDWLATLHTDLHWQSESWWRVFNDHEFGRLDEYFTMNLAAIFVNEEAGWNIMAYIKNVTDVTAITGAFLFSDDTGLTTNAFLTEPRLYGVRVTKAWNGGSPLGSFGERRDGPYPFTLELGGDVQRHDAPYETLESGFSGDFSPALDIFDQAQNQDLDWGDGRQVRLTWRPSGGPWSISAGARYGRTNGVGPKVRAEEDTEPVCFIGGYLAFLCPDFPTAYVSNTNWSDASARSREEHQLVDFAVSRDIGIGGLSQSALSLGVRYAQFKSTTDAHMDGTPDWNFPAGYLTEKYPVTHTRRETTLEANREFDGAGPVLTWEASRHLLGNDESGHIDADWSIGGGVLFGKQKSSIAGAEVLRYYGTVVTFEGFGLLWAAPDSTTTTPVDIHRTKSANVPTVAASLGLSYRIDRMTVGAGYRWERYFDVLDAGQSAAKDYDRTIDGPYFKIAVGFGG